MANADPGTGPSEPKRKDEKTEYTYGNKKYSPQAYYEKLKELKRRQQATWWTFINVVLVGNAVRLVCVCGKEFSATNPSTVAPKHVRDVHMSRPQPPGQAAHREADLHTAERQGAGWQECADGGGGGVAAAELGGGVRGWSGMEEAAFGSAGRRKGNWTASVIVT
ncbi:hypothetical protein VOLCADRAFT_99126 [Volvox carteri f. nagariensis]|uniref:MTF2030 n=1 Tax=Volvox carteri f. nagariensis TaxID=3068 RepID=D8UH25_VOLCA|nr:uncharacterized protein VOLCADRAFT_99126 [Volvox carteri f. nagariensis]ADI46883.1 MTF2030 [Volvox carteri f. nagariensis]EFJ40998.1 hypothetical protein VOLCADRAFT_99126 [Volvox carteri f. nagariensis]|eukprot:XP_002957972.1 hypothetical protein VOLCADRAFT_99126 [Volvox carteri f. nagariensis]